MDEHSNGILSYNEKKKSNKETAHEKGYQQIEKYLQ